MNNFIHYPIFSKITKSYPAGVVLSYIVGLTREINPNEIDFSKMIAYIKEFENE